MYGELIPLGGGDPVPLLKKQLLVGRRESCDIVLRFDNVSAHHCQLTLNNGYWFVRDVGSRNGIKVNGFRTTEKRLDPGDTLSIAKHRYEVSYSPAENGAIGPPPVEDVASDIMGRSLLERAGLSQKMNEPDPRDRQRRYNADDDSEGQIRDPNKPL